LVTEQPARLTLIVLAVLHAVCDNAFGLLGPPVPAMHAAASSGPALMPWWM